MGEEQDDYNINKTIIRIAKNADNPFVMIDKRPLEKPYLSWKAKGLLAYLLSRPDDWTIRLGDLVKRSTEGEYATRQAIKELEEVGHITKTQERKDGQFAEVIYTVYESPLRGFPQAGKPQADNPQAGNLALTNNDLTNTDNTNTDNTNTIDWKEGRKEAQERKAKPKKDAVDALIEIHPELQAQTLMRQRVETVLHRSPPWDTVRSPWNGYDKKLVLREKETGQSIEGFMKWFNSDEFRKKQTIYLNPTRIEDWWLTAFPAGSGLSAVERALLDAEKAKQEEKDRDEYRKNVTTIP